MKKLLLMTTLLFCLPWGLVYADPENPVEIEILVEKALKDAAQKAEKEKAPTPVAVAPVEVK
ncbi:MAG: hypothetical protein LBQ97_08555 [Fusobacteriaceae bacterium]|jgi:hypothetical protein|nr:hypothetical protein [Fusobacteriaceae bacterium]